MALGGGPLPRGRPGALARGVHADQDRRPARGGAVRPTSVEEGKELTGTGYRSNSAWISFPASSGAPVRFDVIATTMRESRSTPNAVVPPTELPPWETQRWPRPSVATNQPTP